MFGSYGSYGSYGSMTSSTPLDIPSTSYLYSPSSNTQCAFPSWPRRDSLSGDSSPDLRATSFLSDDDLMDPFEDDASSVNSASSSSHSSPIQHIPLTEEQILEAQRERMVMQRQVTAFIIAEKERRKAAAASKKKRSSGKKTPKSKLGAMTPITE